MLDCVRVRVEFFAPQTPAPTCLGSIPQRLAGCRHPWCTLTNCRHPESSWKTIRALYTLWKTPNSSGQVRHIWPLLRKFSPSSLGTELEDTLNFGTNDPPTLSLLDSTLRRFLALCAAYHGTWPSLMLRWLYSYAAVVSRAIPAKPIPAGTCLRSDP